MSEWALHLHSRLRETVRCVREWVSHLGGPASARARKPNRTVFRRTTRCHARSHGEVQLSPKIGTRGIVLPQPDSGVDRSFGADFAARLVCPKLPSPRSTPDIRN